MPRHMPGVAALGPKIFVCGGTDENWVASGVVEVLDTVAGRWERLPDLLVPRVQPAVAQLGDCLVVAGGRNSNKTELMSVEVR